MESKLRKEQRKARSLARNLYRQRKQDSRTVSERGYDLSVSIGVCDAQAGSCIAAVVNAR